MPLYDEGLSYDAGIQGYGDLAPIAPKLGWRNLYREAVSVTGTPAVAGHPHRLAFDGLTATVFRSTTPFAAGSAPTKDGYIIELTLADPAQADYTAVAAHNLAGAQLLTHWHDGQQWIEAHSAVTVGSNAPFAVGWAAGPSSTRWRLYVFKPSFPEFYCGAVHIGLRTEPDSGLPLDWSPPSLNERAEYVNPISVGGQLLHRQVRRHGVEARVDLAGLSYAFARGEWLEFIESAQEWPFFFWWNMGSFQECVYGGLEEHGGGFRPGRLVNTHLVMRGINR